MNLLKLVTSMVTIGFLVSGCGSNSTNDLKGRFIDSSVSGLDYECGGKRAKTSSDGSFECSDSSRVSFFIGKIKLGSITTVNSNGMVTPQDLVGVNWEDINNPKVIKIATILQSLDSDGDASNGITLDTSAFDNLKDDIDLLNPDVNITKVVHSVNPNIKIKTKAEVIKHLQDSMISLGIGHNPIGDNNGTDDGNTSGGGNPIDDNNGTNDGNTTGGNGGHNPIGDNNGTDDGNTSGGGNPIDDNNGTNDGNTTGGNGGHNPIGDNNGTDDGNTTGGGNGGDNPIGDNNGTDDGNTSVNITLSLASSLPQVTKEESVDVELKATANSSIFVNGVSSSTANSSGDANVTLALLSEGENNFTLQAKDDSNHSSDELKISITRDTTPPNNNMIVEKRVTDDTTPPITGTMPSPKDGEDISKFKVKIGLDGKSYSAVVNGTKWEVADNTIDELALGKYDVNITVTDEAGNSAFANFNQVLEIDNTGFLIDSALDGIYYESGKYTGLTDVDGLFKYDKDAGVTFYLGDNNSSGVLLGHASVKADPHHKGRRIISLFDLAGTNDEHNPKVVNMARLLQSLDEDANPSNGITISKATRESIAVNDLRNHIDFNLDTQTFANSSDIFNLFVDLAGHFGRHRGLVSADEAIRHIVAVRDNKEPTQSFSAPKVSGKKEKVVVLMGLFKSIGGVVSGVDYRSGSQRGRTNENGEFKYEDGQSVTFLIGELELGTTQGSAVVTPANLALTTSFNNPKPRNIVRLLNAFDAVANDDKITIDQADRDALAKYRNQIDLDLPDGKGNEKLGIPNGEDEFGAQFDDFEMGKLILDEIENLRK